MYSLTQGKMITVGSFVYLEKTNVHPQYLRAVDTFDTWSGEEEVSTEC